TVLRKIDISTSRPVVRSALRLAPLLFARPGELVRMRWTELDLDAGQWRYFVTKTKRTHIAALSTQAIEILRDLHPLTGRGEFVFPGGRDPRKHMSGNAILVAARRCGIEKDESTIHGFRHMASTLLNEMGHWNPDAIESALTHKMPGVRGIYNQAQYLDERRKMMQSWADNLDTLKADAANKVVPFKHRVARA
ncbi:site-specific integrase, partial [Xanthomonas campestris]